MTLLEDINSGKYNIILFGILFFLFFHNYWVKFTEPMANLEVTPQLKDAIKQVYMADVEAIRNLSEVASKLQAGGLTIPGNLTISGAMSVKGNSSVEGNSTVNGSFNYLPKGTIVLWGGTTAPAGWALCNGQNGTPNLQGRFVLGWNPAGGKHPKVPGSDYNQINGVGGNQVHQLTAGEMPAHTHGMNEAGHHGHGMGGAICSNMSGCGYKQVVTRDRGGFGTDGAGNHTHQIHNAGGNDVHNTMPPYYILAYIMKL